MATSTHLSKLHHSIQPAKLSQKALERKSNKPIMEKKRRARINHCLNQLKALILETNNERSRHSKLEKADILEMTVRYLQTLRTYHILSGYPLPAAHGHHQQVPAGASQAAMQHAAAAATVGFSPATTGAPNQLHLQHHQLPQMHSQSLLGTSPQVSPASSYGDSSRSSTASQAAPSPTPTNMQMQPTNLSLHPHQTNGPHQQHHHLSQLSLNLNLASIQAQNRNHHHNLQAHSHPHPHLHQNNNRQQQQQQVVHSSTSPSSTWRPW